MSMAELPDVLQAAWDEEESPEETVDRALPPEDELTDTDPEPGSVSLPEVSREEADRLRARDQKEHNERVEKVMDPVETPTDALLSMRLDPPNLTTLKYLKRLGSSFLSGTVPSGFDEITREIGCYLLMHDQSRPLAERSRLSRLPQDAGGELDLVLDELLAGIPLRECRSVFERIAGLIAAQMGGAVEPIPDESDKTGDSEGNA